MKLFNIIGTTIEEMIENINKLILIIERYLPEINLTTQGNRDGYVKILNWCLQWGTTASVTLNATAGEYDYVNTTVTFSPAFASAPTVIASPSSPNTPGVSAYVGSAPTTTTVLLQASINLPAHPANTTCKIAWIAIGKL